MQSRLSQGGKKGAEEFAPRPKVIRPVFLKYDCATGYLRCISNKRGIGFCTLWALPGTMKPISGTITALPDSAKALPGKDTPAPGAEGALPAMSNPARNHLFRPFPNFRAFFNPRAFLDFLVLFSGISTRSNLARTQGRPLNARGIFLFRRK
jgi:hypothetical protein